MTSHSTSERPLEIEEVIHLMPGGRQKRPVAETQQLRRLAPERPSAGSALRMCCSAVVSPPKGMRPGRWPARPVASNGRLVRPGRSGKEWPSQPFRPSSRHDVRRHLSRKGLDVVGQLVRQRPYRLVAGSGDVRGPDEVRPVLQDRERVVGRRCLTSVTKGDCWDNSPTESLWGSLNVGRLYGRGFPTQREAMDEVIDGLTFYSHRRLHSTLGCIGPMKFEENWRAGQAKRAA